MSKCQMSSCQKDVKCKKKINTGLWRRFIKKLIGIMRFTDIDVNFDIIYDDHQKLSKFIFDQF